LEIAVHVLSAASCGCRREWSEPRWQGANQCQIRDSSGPDWQTMDLSFSSLPLGIDEAYPGAMSSSQDITVNGVQAGVPSAWQLGGPSDGSASRSGGAW